MMNDLPVEILELIATQLVNSEDCAKNARPADSVRASAGALRITSRRFSLLTDLNHFLFGRVHLHTTKRSLANLKAVSSSQSLAKVVRCVCLYHPLLGWDRPSLSQYRHLISTHNNLTGEAVETESAAQEYLTLRQTQQSILMRYAKDVSRLLKQLPNLDIIETAFESYGVGKPVSSFLEVEEMEQTKRATYLSRHHPMMLVDALDHWRSTTRIDIHMVRSLDAVSQLRQPLRRLKLVGITHNFGTTIQIEILGKALRSIQDLEIQFDAVTLREAGLIEWLGRNDAQGVEDIVDPKAKHASAIFTILSQAPALEQLRLGSFGERTEHLTTYRMGWQKLRFPSLKVFEIDGFLLHEDINDFCTFLCAHGSTLKHLKLCRIGIACEDNSWNKSAAAYRRLLDTIRTHCRLDTLVVSSEQEVRGATNFQFLGTVPFPEGSRRDTTGFELHEYLMRQGEWTESLDSALDR